MDYINQFIALVNGVKLTTVIALVIIDFILGILVALKEGTFQLSKIANFLNTSVLYYIGGYFLLGMAATCEPGFGAPLVTGAWVLLDATMVGSILGKLKKLGIPVPNNLSFLS